MVDPAAVWFPARELVPWKDNYLDHPQAQLDVIKASIRRNGWGSPCTAQDTTGRLIIGHGRLTALLQLMDGGEQYDGEGELATWDPKEAAKLIAGMVPVRFRRVPDDRAAELALADNEAARLAVKDVARMDRVIARLHAVVPIDRRAVGLPPDQVAAALRRIHGKPARKDVNPPEPPPPPANPVSEPGQVYELGPHRLVCGDSHTAEIRELLMQGERADAAVTDPPFAIYGSSSGLSSSVADDAMVRPFFRACWVALAASVKVFGHVYVSCDWRSYPSLWDTMKGTGIQPANLLVWDKGHQGLGTKWPNTYELILFGELLPKQGTMRSSITGHRLVTDSNVLRHAKVHPSHRDHNAQKPQELYAQIIEAATDAGETVVDYYAGSGTTLWCCARLGRIALLADKDPAMCDLIRWRWYQWATDAGVEPGPGALEQLGAPAELPEPA